MVLICTVVSTGHRGKDRWVVMVTVLDRYKLVSDIPKPLWSLSRYIPARDRIPLVSMQLTGTWNLRETCKIFSWRMRITRYHQKSNDHLETVLVQVQGPFDWHAAEKASLSWMHNSRPLMTGPTSRASSLHLLLSIHWYSICENVLIRWKPQADKVIDQNPCPWRRIA